ncbi:MAG: mismatch repair endonuclease MutL [Bacteroidota bacterium]
MTDIIQLLPDHVANQIAAGEVVQRPASVVKELLENAIDAGADTVQLILKDAGRTLVQVIDNGQGMSQGDARLCFERHATSKIAQAEDLFRLQTKGFRGEALASIASVAQVELKTRRAEDELGTLVRIDASKIEESSPCQCSIGSSFSVKNLFYNIPARRQFLKTDVVETRHVMDEFQRVALAHPDVAMSMHHNGSEVYHLTRGTLRQRMVALFGAKYDERLVPVDEQTDLVQISGFIGKPEFARKTRGEQFFFVNHRFIRHSYLHHAVTAALEGLIPEGSFPLYALFLEVDPAQLDVNIHPTKTEVKFTEERAIYSILRSAVKRSLGQFQVAPTLDFETENAFQITLPPKDRPVPMPGITINPNYNPFATQGTTKSAMSPGQSSFIKHAGDSWKDLYEVIRNPQPVSPPEQILTNREEDDKQEVRRAPVFQVGKSYIVTSIRSGMMVIDQQRAHQRILFEHFLRIEGGHGCQQLLFPQTLHLSASDHAMIVSSQDILQQMGFDVEDFGGQEVVVRGVPAEGKQQDPEELLNDVLHQLRSDLDPGESQEHRLAAGLAAASSIKRGQILQQEEMHTLIDQLFACEVPNYSPRGKKAVVTFTPEEFTTKFM